MKTCLLDSRTSCYSSCSPGISYRCGHTLYPFGNITATQVKISFSGTHHAPAELAESGIPRVSTCGGCRFTVSGGGGWCVKDVATAHHVIRQCVFTVFKKLRAESTACMPVQCRWYLRLQPLVTSVAMTTRRQQLAQHQHV